jgi:hypothetical protein
MNNSINVDYIIHPTEKDVYIKLSDLMCYLTNREIFINNNVANTKDKKIMLKVVKNIYKDLFLFREEVECV